MKKFLKMLLERTNEFISDKRVEKPMVDTASITTMIELAIRKKSGIHVIFLDKSFTGDIVKYDKERQQLIVKNFKKSVSTIIRISDIKRISLVPKTIREAQQLNVRVDSKKKSPKS